MNEVWYVPLSDFNYAWSLVGYRKVARTMSVRKDMKTPYDGYYLAVSGQQSDACWTRKHPFTILGSLSFLYMTKLSQKALSKLNHNLDSSINGRKYFSWGKSIFDLRHGPDAWMFISNSDYSLVVKLPYSAQSYGRLMLLSHP